MSIYLFNNIMRFIYIYMYIFERSSTEAHGFFHVDSSSFHEEEVWCCYVIGSTLLRTASCAHRFFFYPFTASDGYEGTFPDCVVSRPSIMVQYGLRNKEARRARKQNIDYVKQHHHHLLVARQGDLSSKLNKAFLLVEYYHC